MPTKTPAAIATRIFCVKLNRSTVREPSAVTYSKLAVPGAMRNKQPDHSERRLKFARKDENIRNRTQTQTTDADDN